MKNLALIPARGGSKRIPKKNIRNFFGKPIIAYSIDSALASGLFDQVMVSTDDEEIAEIAKTYGAVVPFLRSSETSDDHATLSDVIKEVATCYEELGESFDYICCLLATAPLLKIEYLEKGYNIIKCDEADSVRPVVRFPYPIQRALTLKNGWVEMINKEHKRTRSQDLEPAYYDAAQFYWMKFDQGLEGGRKAGFEIPKYFAQDIDDEEDWKLAELKYKAWFQ